MSDIKLAQLWNSQAAMQRLLHSDKLEPVLSWRLSKLVKVLQEIEEQHVALVKKLGQKDPESGLTEVLPKNMPAYREQFEALLDDLVHGSDSSFLPLEGSEYIVY